MSFSFLISSWWGINHINSNSDCNICLCNVFGASEGVLIRYIMHYGFFFSWKAIIYFIRSTHLLSAQQLRRIDFRIVRQPRRYDDILVRHVEQRQTARGLRKKKTHTQKSTYLHKSLTQHTEAPARSRQYTHRTNSSFCTWLAMCRST